MFELVKIAKTQAEETGTAERIMRALFLHPGEEEKRRDKARHKEREIIQINHNRNAVRFRNKAGFTRPCSD